MCAHMFIELMCLGSRRMVIVYTQCISCCLRDCLVVFVAGTTGAAADVSQLPEAEPRQLCDGAAGAGLQGKQRH